VKYCYSYDEERYHGSFDSREEALVEARGDDTDRRVWTAEVVPAERTIATIATFRIGDLALEAVEEDLGDEIPSDDRILEYSDANAKDLGRVILQWIIANVPTSAFTVDNVVEHPPEPRP